MLLSKYKKYFMRETVLFGGRGGATAHLCDVYF